MIDMNARANLANQRQTQGMIAGLKDAIVTGLKTKQESGAGEDVLRLVFKKEEDMAQTNAIEKISKALVLIYNQIKKPITIPKILTVQGKVDIGKQPAVTISNLKDLEKYFNSLEQRLIVFAQAATMAPVQKIDFPKFDFPKNEPIDVQGIINAIQDLEKVLPASTKSPDTSILRKIESHLSSLESRPVMTPQPVTNVWINPSEGYCVTTSNTVGTTAITLPQYGQLENRRSLLIYNNSSNTIYIGGSTVTVANGLPIPAGAYAPSLDAGYSLPIYGVAASTGNNVRCIEMSKDITGNIQL